MRFYPRPIHESRAPYGLSGPTGNPEPEEWTGLTGAAISVLTQLKRAPGQDVDQIAAALWRSVSAIRPVLKRLHLRGYVEYEAVGQGPGRRRHLYSLTERGESVFPNNVQPYARALTEFVQQEDPALFERFMATLGKEWTDAVTRRSLTATSPLDVEQLLVETLADNGFLPELTQDDGVHELVLHHCPYLPVGEVCVVLCQRDRHGVERLLGATIEEAESRIAGDTTCRIRYLLPEGGP